MVRVLRFKGTSPGTECSNGETRDAREGRKAGSCRMTSAEAKRSVVDYMSAARALRRRMDLNLRDAKFAHEESGEIVYFVDADVAATFADPRSNLHYFDLLAAWLDTPLLFSTAILTLEYIFSGSLPG